jgi:hypothetical protein
MLYRSPNYLQYIASGNGDVALFKMRKGTNLDIKQAACLHIVHNLQHPTSHPIPESVQGTMVNAPKMNSLQL